MIEISRRKCGVQRNDLDWVMSFGNKSLLTLRISYFPYNVIFYDHHRIIIKNKILNNFYIMECTLFTYKLLTSRKKDNIDKAVNYIDIKIF